MSMDPQSEFLVREMSVKMDEQGFFLIMKKKYAGQKCTGCRNPSQDTCGRIAKIHFSIISSRPGISENIRGQSWMVVRWMRCANVWKDGKKKIIANMPK